MSTETTKTTNESAAVNGRESRNEPSVAEINTAWARTFSPEQLGTVRNAALSETLAQCNQPLAVALTNQAAYLTTPELVNQLARQITDTRLQWSASPNNLAFIAPTARVLGSDIPKPVDHILSDQPNKVFLPGTNITTQRFRRDDDVLRTYLASEQNKDVRTFTTIQLPEPVTAIAPHIFKTKEDENPAVSPFRAYGVEQVWEGTREEWKSDEELWSHVAGILDLLLYPRRTRRAWKDGKLAVIAFNGLFSVKENDRFAWMKEVPELTARHIKPYIPTHILGMRIHAGIIVDVIPVLSKCFDAEHHFRNPTVIQPSYVVRYMDGGSNDYEQHLLEPGKKLSIPGRE